MTNNAQYKSSITDKFNKHKEDIVKKNYINMKNFVLGGMFLAGIIALAAYFSYGAVPFFSNYFILFLYFVALNILMVFYFNDMTEKHLINIYLMITPIFLMGIYMGTFGDTTGGAVTIFILICTIPMIITDKPSHITSYTLVISCVFLIASYISKSHDIFMMDLINASIYISIGLGVNLLTLSDRVNSVEEFQYMREKAEIDHLTSIMNRGSGEKAVASLLNKNQFGSFFILDIDDFKSFNDTYGHDLGDKVLKKVAEKLSDLFDNKDIICRMGGDEFVVFSLQYTNQKTLESTLHRLKKNLESVLIDSKKINIKISIGGVICDQNNCTFKQVYNISDTNLYNIKNSGKNNCCISYISGISKNSITL